VGADGRTMLAMGMRLFAAALSLAASAVIVGVACGTAGSSNGGSAGPASAFCKNTYSQLQQCESLQVSSSCISALVQACAQQLETQGVLSQAAIQATASCGPEFSDCSCMQGECSDAAVAQEGTWAQCVEAQVAAAPTSPTFQKLQSDFCASCPDGASSANPTSCSTFIGTSAAPGVGAALAIYGDSVLAQIDQSCTGAALKAFDADSGSAYDCYEAFSDCYSPIASSANLSLETGFNGSVPSACAGGITFDAGGE
jgi:hypothetical protein